LQNCQKPLTNIRFYDINNSSRTVTSLVTPPQREEIEMKLTLQDIISLVDDETSTTPKTPTEDPELQQQLKEIDDFAANAAA